jgi:hypothetical protein
MAQPLTTNFPPPNRITAWAQQMRHLRVFRAVHAKFDAARIPVLPVKGILSAHTLYDDVADRLLTDIDLKIRPADFDRVVALCAREGWRVVQRMRAYANVVFVVEGVYVDVEGYPSVPGLSHLTVDAMLQRARPSELLGFPHLLPSFDDHAVVLLLNAFKDKLIHTFVWAVRDLERLPAHRDFDAGRLVRILRATGTTTIGWIVADWMIRGRDIAGWNAVRDAIGARPPRRAYAAVFEALCKVAPRWQLAMRVVARVGADDLGDRARALGRMAWWQVENLASQWGDAPFRRNDPSTLAGTVHHERRP